MDQKETVFFAGFNCPSADGGWPQVDVGTFEDEALSKSTKWK